MFNIIYLKLNIYLMVIQQHEVKIQRQLKQVYPLKTSKIQQKIVVNFII